MRVKKKLTRATAAWAVLVAAVLLAFAAATFPTAGDLDDLILTAIIGAIRGGRTAAYLLGLGHTVRTTKP